MNWDDSIEILGSWLTHDGDGARDLSVRLRKARKIWYIFRHQLSGLRFNHSLAIRVWKSTVMSCLLYGCEIQDYPVQYLQVLRRFMNRCLRGIMHINIMTMKGVRTMTDVRLQAKVEDIETWICRRQLTWLGRTVRKGPL